MMPKNKQNNGAGAEADPSTQPPPGIPLGLPKDQWLPFLEMKMKLEFKAQKVKDEQERDLEMEKLRLENEEKARQAELRKLELTKNSTQSSPEGKPKSMKVPRLQDDEDTDMYLRAFELLAETNG